jgi:outer membrane protein assembly factor BamB
LNGKEIWRADVGEKLNGWGSAASPILHGNLLIINASVESDSLVALDKSTGKEVWRAGGIKESWNTPIVVKTPEGKAELVVAIFGKVLGFDPETGTQLWSCETKIPGTWFPAPLRTKASSIASVDAGAAVRSQSRRVGAATSVNRTFCGGEKRAQTSHRLCSTKAICIGRATACPS